MREPRAATILFPVELAVLERGVALIRGSKRVDR
jgi:hypothetical protein